MMANLGNEGTHNAPPEMERGITPEWLMHQHRQQQEVNASIMATLQELRRTLDTRIGAETPITVPTPVTPGPVPEVARRPKHALPHPSIFDGTNLMDYASFKGFLKTKYRIDAAVIGGKTEQV